MSSKTAHCDAGISLFTLQYSVRATQEHGDVEAPTEEVGEKKKGERRRTKLLWTQEMWKCVALQNMLPVGREKTGMKSKSKP